MAGNVKRMIDLIIEQRSKGSPALIKLTKAKISLKGINPDKYTETSEDNPIAIEKLKALAEELNIKL